MLELFLVISPFLFIAGCYLLLMASQMNVSLCNTLIKLSIVLALQAFGNVLINVHSYRRTELTLTPGAAQLKAQEEIKDGLQWMRSLYLNNAYLAAYGMVFTLSFAFCAVWAFRARSRSGSPIQ